MFKEAKKIYDRKVKCVSVHTYTNGSYIDFWVLDSFPRIYYFYFLEGELNQFFLTLIELNLLIFYDNLIFEFKRQIKNPNNLQIYPKSKLITYYLGFTWGY